ncbi:MAG TPA: 2-C-methyl-D-erythritol 4-phosphate cytidylyltransferase [Dehalococcoidia bacterium]|nr:2-C-methyl-D-erythritol 4-phosphate cytidylyltransferase [Dehalococcoidia bacterium]
MPQQPGIKDERTAAIIVAAGSSRRMKGADKLLAPLGGRPLISYSIATFAAYPAIDELVVVASEANLDAVRGIIGASETANVTIVMGGKRRRDSVLNGLRAVRDCDYVVVHDAARPLVDSTMIDAALGGAREVGAALCAIPVSDTVKRADPAGRVSSTVTREGLWLAQTPQAFRTELLLRAHATIDIDVTDDAALIELVGEPVKLVMGSNRNIKVTLPEDLALAQALFAASEGKAR